MIGKIATRQKCPGCGGTYQRGMIYRGKFQPGGDSLACPNCKITPDKVYINLHFQAASHSIRHDKRGVRFESIVGAQQVLNEIRVEHRQGIFDPAEYKTNSPKRFEKYFTAWVKRHQPQQSTYRKLIGLNRNYFAPFFAGLNMQDVRKFDLENFFVWIDENRKVSDRYKLDIWTWLRAIFQSALDDEFITKMPKFPAKPKFKKKRIQWLTSSEQLLVVNEIPERHRDIFRFLIESGVRVSEACALQRDCIGPDFYVIKRTLSDRRLKENTKNKKELVKFMPPKIAEIINRQPANFSGFIFTNPDGKHLSRHYTEDFLASLWNVASQKAGVELMPLKNGTRHSWASSRAVAGFSPEQIADGLGHSDAKMAKHYMTADLERQKAMYE